jgi:phage-related protein
MSQIWGVSGCFAPTYTPNLGIYPVENGRAKIIGEDIKTVQFGWPLGMPVVRKLAPNLWEVRSKLQNRIARVLFTVEGPFMVLLHGFIKKSQKTPPDDLALAKERLSILRGER